MKVKEMDLAVEIAEIRNILRQSAQRGEIDHRTDGALQRLAALAAEDESYGFEYQRWRVHVECIRALFDSPLEAPLGSVPVRA